MRYLKKVPTSEIVQQNLNYKKGATVANRKIRQILSAEQLGFCAYSERFLRPLDAFDVEHFDPRLKHTDQDSYWNWYSVLHWVNQHKAKKIEPFEPLLAPYADDLMTRIRYAEGIFVPIDPNDHLVQNLIDFLGVNRPEVYEERRKHVRRIVAQQNLYMTAGWSKETFWDDLVDDPDKLSFFSALQAELGLPDELLDRLATIVDAP
jgi:hypothetical protein